MPATIVQIIPAEPGWHAAYLNRDKSNEWEAAKEEVLRGNFRTFNKTSRDLFEEHPIICWALVEREGKQTVEGMDVPSAGRIGLCEERANFAAYLPPAISFKEKL